ncbi:hypothetical protein [Soonwooa sp.]|uniref:hypothetical protein n=1 Tax=Soonwooa sp. TaxID=1938592 RepID=UPI0026260315|nr:hypothetical protein [Soonwooa sp.]
MKKESVEFFLYYKGENESPIKSGNFPLYWWYEKCFYEKNKNPTEEEYKDFIFTLIDQKISEHFMSFDKALKDYLNVEKNKNCR